MKPTEEGKAPALQKIAGGAPSGLRVTAAPTLAGFLPAYRAGPWPKENCMKVSRVTVCIAAALFATACTQAPPAPTPPEGSGGQQNPILSNQEADWQRILDLEEEAKALVKAGGCASDDQCRTAPVGSRACGGPRYYLVYCSRTTDSVALFRKLADVEGAERAYNRKYQLVSTCEFRMPPTVGVNAGTCQAR